jgi:poly-gamma-glutamate capsule biosynthesis protein CapA/YwtB (metallophosphatase superfamily)
MTEPTITICAVGDIRADHVKGRRNDPDEVFALCRRAFSAADVSFFNCEGVYSDRVVTVPKQHTSGQANVADLAGVARAGFAVAGMANNHAMDLGAEGLFDTIDLARSLGMEVCGAGANLTEARRPAVVESRGIKVAFLSYNCVGPVEYGARAGRAGVAAIGVSTLYEAIEHQPGTPCRVMTYAERADLSSLADDIARARQAADIVITNFHWGMHHVQALIGMYQQEIAHAAIEAGADVVQGGGDHVVKGVDFHRGAPILYGLGDFILDTPITEKTETPWRKMKQVLYDLEYDRDYPTYPFPPEARFHLIAKYVATTGGVRSVSLLPCLVTKLGQPALLTQEDAGFAEVSHYVEAISRHQGFATVFGQDGGDLVVSEGPDPGRPIGPTYTSFLLPPLSAGPRPTSWRQKDVSLETDAPRL